MRRLLRHVPVNHIVLEQERQSGMDVADKCQLVRKAALQIFLFEKHLKPLQEGHYNASSGLHHVSCVDNKASQIFRENVNERLGGPQCQG